MGCAGATALKGRGTVRAGPRGYWQKAGHETTATRVAQHTDRSTVNGWRPSELWSGLCPWMKLRMSLSQPVLGDVRIDLCR